jgi:hypothetical protein
MREVGHLAEKALVTIRINNVNETTLLHGSAVWAH